MQPPLGTKWTPSCLAEPRPKLLHTALHKDPHLAFMSEASPEQMQIMQCFSKARPPGTQWIPTWLGGHGLPNTTRVEPSADSCKQLSEDFRVKIPKYRVTF